MEDRSGQILGVCCLFLSLSWLTVMLRVYVRTRIIKSFGIDDTVMLVTLGLFTAYCSCQLGGVAHGTGKRRSEMTDESAQTALRFWFFCEIFYTLSTSTLKIAVGFFLLRITINRIHVWLLRTLMVCSAVLGVSYCLVVIFQCRPISFWWDLDPTHHGKCIGATTVMNLTYVVSALNSIADWVFGCLPIFIVKDLQMKLSAKIIVSTIIGLAAIGSTATLIRLPYTSSLNEIKGELLWRTSDFAMWTTVEVGIGITAACLATLKPLMKQFLSFFGIHTTRNGSTLPWSAKPSNPPSKFGFNPEHPGGGKSMTTTTVTGRGGITGNDSEEDMFPIRGGDERSFLELSDWKGGISKSVQVTTTEERDSTRSGPSLNRVSEERHVSEKPAMIYERL